MDLYFLSLERLLTLRGIRKTLARSAAALSLVAAVVFAGTSPASAHTVEEAVRAPAGCAWLSGTYNTLHSSPVRTSGGTTYGTVYLLWSSTYQQNCVITLKTGSTHGVATQTRAELFLQSGGSYWEQSNFAHYSAVTAAAGGQCVAYEGRIQGTTGTWATGGRAAWGNCG